jgi:hypothetical protein
VRAARGHAFVGWARRARRPVCAGGGARDHARATEHERRLPPPPCGLRAPAR